MQIQHGKRSHSEQSDFRESVYQHQRRYFSVPIFCAATLLGYPRQDQAAPKLDAHHIKPYVLTADNSVQNGVLISVGFHAEIHRQVQSWMRDFTDRYKVNAYSVGMDFVSPITRALVSASFNYALSIRPELKVAEPNRISFAEKWEAFLVEKSLL
jgi:hypothetical protein